MLHAYVAFREISLEIADARADPPQAWTAQLSLPKAAKPQAWRPKHVVMWGRLNSTIDHPHVSARTSEISDHHEISRVRDYVPIYLPQVRARARARVE